MALFEQKEGTFSIFTNDHKTKQTQPDRRGTANVSGVIYEISGWIREDRNCKKYLAGTIKLKDERQSAPRKEPDSGEVPF